VSILREKGKKSEKSQRKKTKRETIYKIVNADRFKRRLRREHPSRTGKTTEKKEIVSMRGKGKPLQMPLPRGMQPEL